MPSPLETARIVKLAEALERAGHGERGRLVAACAAELQVSEQTVRSWVKPYRAGDRKRRADAGEAALSRDEAMRIALAVKYGISELGKRRVTLETAVTWLRENRMIRAERVDAGTGESLPLSRTAIARAMEGYRLSADLLATPAPHQSLRSLHPNHVWQADASVCVVFYLPKGGVALVDERDLHHNHPEHGQAIELFRVIRYVMTDHYSSLTRWRYFPHAESGEATCDFLAWCMARKQEPSRDPFHGRPRILMVDPGATSSGTVKRFCRRMGIRLMVTKPKNPRAKGQVERGQNLVEMKFESGLLHVRHRIRDFDDLNRLAEVFQIHFNATVELGRTGAPRLEGWRSISREDLVETAPYAQLKQFITGAPETPKVAGDLSVRFAGRRWDARQVPDVVIGEKLEVCASPFVGEGACAVRTGADGRETLIPLTEILKDAGSGFRLDAPVIGEQYAAMPDTVVERNKKELAALATGRKALAEAEREAGKKGFQPFGELLNPYLAAEAKPSILTLPRRGTPMEAGAEVVLPSVAPVLVPTVRAARRMKEAAGEAWSPETYEWLVRKYPAGVPEDELERLVAQAARPVFRMVQGG